MEILPFDECLRLLASVPVGRVGFIADGELVMLPVNHVVDGHDVAFRTARGSKLSAAEGQNLATFEADHYNEQIRSGWSVVVTGRAEIVDAEADVQRLVRRGLWELIVLVVFRLRLACPEPVDDVADRFLAAPRTGRRSADESGGVREPDGI